MDEMIIRTCPVEVKETKQDRVLEFIGSTETMDRDGEIIRADGWDLKNYRKNPVFMWAHNYNQPPIGRAVSTRVKDGNLTFKVEFADEDTYEFADTIYRLYKGGFLHATSVGFVPKEWEDGDEKGARRIYTKQELLELSGVPVPSNPDALVSARDAGVITTKEFEVLTKPETTEEYHRIPVSGEEGKHEGHRIRTIDISKEKGIKALYCGQCKKVITYLFSKDKWTMAEAQRWVDEHKEYVQVIDAGGTELAEVEREEETASPLAQSQILDELDYAKHMIEDNELEQEAQDIAFALALSIREKLDIQDVVEESETESISSEYEVELVVTPVETIDYNKLAAQIARDVVAQKLG